MTAAAMMAWALAGCVNYSGIKSEKAPAAATAFETTQSLPSEGGRWPSLDWAAQFGDPQLPKLIAEALEGNPSIAQAQARLAKAQSYIETSRASLFPNVNGSYSITRNRLSANGIFPPPLGGMWYTENNALVSASWDLDLWGKNRARLASAVSQRKAAEADVQQARIALASSVARTYNQLAQLYALRDIAAREVANRNNVSAITRERVTAGLDTNVEKQTALGNIATTETTLTDLDGQITTVRYQLAALIGKGPDRGLHIAEPALSRTAVLALPDNLPADLVSRRPDIVAARWQIESAMQDVKEAKAEFFPDINLSLAAGFDALGWSHFLTSSSRQFNAGPAIHLPIFDAGQLRAQLKGRYADFDFDVAHYNQTLINALSDVATQVESIRTIDREMGDAQRALDASSEAYRLAVIRYKAGLSPQLQVLNADSNRLVAEQTVTNLTMQRRDLQFALIRALGGGFDAQSAGIDVPIAAAVPASAASAVSAN
ncbi:efflux transporter outer membrane subunit [Trinickia sp.]|jgi:NodT family efflux transporter outer membrane factor (OMF) lipoprotein|uniref:efflux transporter outer membrane subunit n=1 Tax=Trinickia sp. TaxID=2571163 RepID=UPI0032C22629